VVLEGVGRVARVVIVSGAPGTSRATACRKDFMKLARRWATANNSG